MKHIATTAILFSLGLGAFPVQAQVKPVPAPATAKPAMAKPVPAKAAPIKPVPAKPAAPKPTPVSAAPVAPAAAPIIAPSPAPVQAKADTGPAVRYTMAFPNAGHHEAKVTATFAGLTGGGPLHVRMARSSPGR